MLYFLRYSTFKIRYIFEHGSQREDGRALVLQTTHRFTLTLEREVFTSVARFGGFSRQIGLPLEDVQAVLPDWAVFPALLGYF